MQHIFLNYLIFIITSGFKRCSFSSMKKSQNSSSVMPPLALQVSIQANDKKSMGILHCNRHEIKLSKIIYHCFMKIINIAHLILTENSDV